MDLFKLVGSVFVDTDAANESLSKTDKKASSVGETLGKVGKGAAAVGTAAVAGAAALTTAVVGMASSSAESMDVVDKASQRMGVSAEYYQELAHAASLSGVEMGTLEKAAKKLEGTDIDMSQALDQIYSMESAEDRARVAAELFGDSVAYQLTPMLNASGEDFAAMRQEANDLGLVMSGDAVAAGAALNDSLSNLKDSAGALMTGVGVELMPIVKQFADMLIGYMPQIHDLFEKLAPIISLTFEKLLPPLMSLIESLLPVIITLVEQLIPPVMDIVGQILPILVQLFDTLMPVFVQLCQMILPVVVNLINQLLPLLDPIIQLLNPILQLLLAVLDPLLQLINLILPPIITLVTSVAGVLSDLLGDAIGWIVDKFTSFKDTTQTVFEKVREFIETPVQKVIDFFGRFKTTVQSVISIVKEKFTDFRDKVKEVFNSIIDFVKKPINAVLGFLNSLISGIVSGINVFIRAINKIHVDVPGWLADLTGVHSIGFNLQELTAPQIPLLAKGGEVEGGQAIVGEDGPELLQTNGQKTRVTPLNDNNNAFVAIEEKLDTLIKLLMNGYGVYLDKDAVVGQLAPSMDKALGRLAVKQGRRI